MCFYRHMYVYIYIYVGKMLKKQIIKNLINLL